MRWEMEMDEIEAMLETIWDLHDKISDAIHAISRSHFLKSIKTLSKVRLLEKKSNQFDSIRGENDEKGGFVFLKDFTAEDVDDDNAPMAEAVSLTEIRTALENLDDQLEFFHTVQSQQRAERDAALARMERSRVILAMRLADHQGKKHKVIEEALAFVGDVRDTSGFVEPEDLYEVPRDQPGETLDDQRGRRSSVLARMLISSFALAKKMDKIGGVLGNAALFAVSMLAFLQLHQVAFRARQPQAQNFFSKRIARSTFMPDSSSQIRHFDVFSARG